MDVFAAVCFLHLTDVPVEVGVRPADEVGSLPLTILAAIPEIFHYLISISSNLVGSNARVGNFSDLTSLK